MRQHFYGGLKIDSSCQRRACPRERVGLASTPLAPRFHSEAQGFRLVDSRLRGNDETFFIVMPA